MKNRLFNVLAIILLFGIFTFPVQAETSIIKNTQKEISQPSPKVVLTTYKTVTKTYTDHSSIPNSIYYEEYRDGLWFSGYLDLKKDVLLGSIWYATFEGTLFSRT